MRWALKMLQERMKERGSKEKRATPTSTFKYSAVNLSKTAHRNAEGQKATEASPDLKDLLERQARLVRLDHPARPVEPYWAWTRP